MSFEAVFAYLGRFAALRRAVEAAEAASGNAGPSPLPDFAIVARHLIVTHERIRGDDARWLLARIGPCDGFWLAYLLEPLTGAPYHPAAWAAAYRHATCRREALLREAPPGALARLVLLEKMPAGADRRALAREVVARLRAGGGVGRPGSVLDLVASRMGPAAELRRDGGLAVRPDLGPYPGPDDGGDVREVIAAITTGGRAEARRAFDCDVTASYIVRELVGRWTFATRADVATALAADPAAREFYRRRRRAARARLVEYVAWRAAATAATAALPALGARGAAALALVDWNYRGCFE